MPAPWGPDCFGSELFQNLPGQKNADSPVVLLIAVRANTEHKENGWLSGVNRVGMRS